MPHKRYACSTAPTSACRRSKPDIRISPTLVSQHVKEATIAENGPSFQTSVVALLHDLLMEEEMLCLVRSSTPRLVSLSQVPELTPTTPLKCWLWLRHCLFLGLVARLPAMRTRVFTMTPKMLLVFAWARFKPAHMSSWHLRTNSRC